MPTVLEMLSYLYYPGSCVLGPFFEFTDYKMFIEEKGRYANIPKSLIPCLIRFGHG